MKAGLMVVALVGGVLTGFSGAVSAADLRYDGNELLRQCQQFIKAADSEADFDRVDAGVCAGFVQGVSSTVFFLSDDLNNEAKFCTPDNATNGQLVRIVVKYLKDNPKKLNMPRTALIWTALRDAYPCK